MKKYIAPIVLALLASSCDNSTKVNVNPNSETKNDKIVELSERDTTPRVTGIGGIFFQCKDVKQTKDWYSLNLGLVMDDYGSPFEFRNANHPEEPNYLRWSVFKNGDEFFKPGKKEFIINYRVQNIEGLVRKLRNNGVIILNEIQTVEYGKFVSIMDADSNKIELWEPVDSFFTKMGGKTTK